MRYYKIIYIIIVAVLLVPLLEQNLELFQRDPLGGYFQTAVKPVLTRKGYFDYLSFQEASEKYANENFGFRNSLLRMRNQIYFSVFDQSPIADYYIGKNKYLFQSNYIDAYYGNDFVGDSVLDRLTAGIQRLQDTLADHHITLLTIIAPSKAWYFPEYISKEMDLTPKDSNTNYGTFLRFAGDKKLNLMDFNASFLKQKGKVDFPLYSRNGTHWSHQSATNSFDSILRKLDQLTGRQFPEMRWIGETENDSHSGENDVVWTMNLFCDPEGDSSLMRPFVQFNKLNGYTPKVLGVTDSYYGVFEELGLLKNCFQSPDYWFGYEHKFPKEKYSKRLEEKDLLKSEIESHEVVILLCTPHNIPKMGWGFIEEALSIYDTASHLGYSYKEVLEIEQQKSYLQASPEWLQDILQQAKDKNIDPQKHFNEYTFWYMNEVKKNK